MIESAMSLRFPAPSTFCYSNASIPYYRPLLSLDDSVNCRPMCVKYCRFHRISGGLLGRRKKLFKSRIRARAEHIGSSDPGKSKGKPSRYHPSEDIAKSSSVSDVDARLNPAETTRTIIEVNSKATLLFSGLFSGEDPERIFWPELPYFTDEHGNMYFKVHHDEEILQSLASENNFVHVIMGLNNMEMFNDIDISGPSEIDFGLEDIEDEDIDVDDDEDGEDDEEDEDDFDEDWVSVLDEDDDDDSDDEAIGDWAKLETMRFSHPMHFAQKMAEVASDGPIDWMRKPPVGLCIHGFLTPVEDHSSIPKHRSDHESVEKNINLDEKTDKDVNSDKINGFQHKSESKDNSTLNEEVEKEKSSRSGVSYYKLEMVRIQLLTPHGQPTFVEVEDFRKAKPDEIAHSASKIVTHFQAGGEKTAQALKSLCWRYKGIQVEEAALISVDSLGFDLRVCSGTQVQTLRFAFDTKATSEYSAERQLNDILFPRTHKSTRKKQTQQKEIL